MVAVAAYATSHTRNAPKYLKIPSPDEGDTSSYILPLQKSP